MREVRGVDFPSWWCRTFHRRRWIRGGVRRLSLSVGAVERICLDCVTQWIDYIDIPPEYQDYKEEIS
jgi:hypothetical protein